MRPRNTTTARTEPDDTVDTDDAEDGGAVVADQLAREADQDRRKGREPRPLRDLPDGRGRGAATDVPGNSVAHRPVARTARASMTGTSGQMRQKTKVEARLDDGKAAGSGSARPNASPFWLLPGRLWSNFVAAEPPGTEDHVQPARNPVNVG
jgi:hypothetical protein